MPIRFRCNSCNRLLGIARRKAGSETKCPHCGASITVPLPNDLDDDRTHLDDIDELINPAANAPGPVPAPVVAAPAAVARPAPPPMPRTSPKSTNAEPMPLTDEERPLFERDVDAVLGTTSKPGAADLAKARPVATSGLDSRSFGSDRGQVVLTSQKATALVVVVVVLLALAFGAGFLIASR